METSKRDDVNFIILLNTHLGRLLGGIHSFYYCP